MACETTVIEPGAPLPSAEGVVLAVYAHGGVTASRQDGYYKQLTLPENVRLVFFYDPRRMDTCAAINIHGVPQTIRTNAGKRYLFKQGCTYTSFPQLVYSFNDPEDPQTMGIRRENGSIVSTELFDRGKMYPLIDVITQLGASYAGQGVITLYFFACGARSDTRSTDTVDLFHIKGGKRRSRRRRNKKRHTHRRRYFK
jgi:hypothetical protein